MVEGKDWKGDYRCPRCVDNLTGVLKGIVCSRGSKILKILIWTFLADLASLRSKIMI